MAVNSAWKDETKTILIISIVGNWTWDEFYSARQLANKMVSEQAQPYFVILDFTNAKKMPANLLSRFRSESSTAPKNRQGVIIVHKQHQLATVFINMVAKLVHLSYELRLVTSFDAAIHYIEQQLQAA
ncbi:MAG: hypothetical protein H6670_04530 [Anaerolineaceae bacterium]|nr:hypothetical protein [Anaerolineae bacterium]MCB9458891.1 hypothetical protein [Anaerolineaceae bacterium]